MMNLKPESYQNFFSFSLMALEEMIFLSAIDEFILFPKEYNRLLYIFTIILKQNVVDDLSQLISLQELRCVLKSGAKNVNTFLQKLFRDLSIDFRTNESYGALILVRVQHLNSLTKDGPPKFTWKQPNGKITDHPSVESFLHSGEVTFVYNAFDSMNQARQWINEYAGEDDEDRHSFTAVARRSENGIEVILQKGTEIYEKEKETFFLLVKEFENLTNQLKVFPKLLLKLNSPVTPDGP